MQQENPTLDDVLKLVERLSPEDKRRLIEHIEPDVGREDAVSTRKPRTSARGLWADLGSAPSAEEIDEARNEAWKSFPREDI